MKTKEFIVIVLTLVMVSLVFLYMFVDEMDDNETERACVEKTEMTNNDGYSPDCDL